MGGFQTSKLIKAALSTPRAVSLKLLYNVDQRRPPPTTFLQEEIPVRLVRQLALLHRQPFADLPSIKALSSNLVATVSSILSLPLSSYNAEMNGLLLSLMPGIIQEIKRDKRENISHLIRGCSELISSAPLQTQLIQPFLDAYFNLDIGMSQPNLN
jgi:hypothetical protein